VLRSVCGQIKSWAQAGIQAPRIAINFSARQFRRKNLHQMIRRALDDFEISGQAIAIELNETAVMESPEDAIQILRELKRMGVQISIDDFGTGYSGIGYLTRLPIDKLKIDCRFVQEATASSDDTAIAAVIIAMAHSLKLKVIAECVETAEQFAFLKSHGCDEVQGFYHREPLPVQQFETLLQSAAVACSG